MAGLYIHIPWCVAKCPYCDFNSHGLNGRQPIEAAYVEALARDLQFERSHVGPQTIDTVFFGGGTPSLFSAASIGRILESVAQAFTLSSAAEITLEANPGASEAARFAGYRDVGVDRLSIGVQSLENATLAKIGRIHDRDAAIAAVHMARDAGFDNLNLDMMFALPGQTPRQAEQELAELISLQPEHISYYQLTLEPGTAFGRRPPPLPAEAESLAIWDTGKALLAEAGYAQYEVSAYTQPGRECAHNLNYWRFGDYVGVGAGAHGKVTIDGALQRRARVKVPAAFMREAGAQTVLDTVETVPVADLPFEFMMNRLRLRAPVSGAELAAAGVTGIDSTLADLEHRGLLHRAGQSYGLTALGHAHLDSVVAKFLPD